MLHHGPVGQVQSKESYNHFHNILRIFDVLPNYNFTTSETIGDYYLKTWLPIASRVKTLDLRKLGNIRKMPKPQRMIPQCPMPLSK